MKKLVIIVISLMCVSVASAKKVKTEQVEGGVKFHIEDREMPIISLVCQSVPHQPRSRAV